MKALVELWIILAPLRGADLVWSPTRGGSLSLAHPGLPSSHASGVQETGTRRCGRKVSRREKLTEVRDYPAIELA
jgi:hypothetical protein